jgi:valyl-tRNA synthetase
MSKSKGNGIDPIEMIGKYGADAVRFALMILTTEGQDIKLSPVKFETGRNFANKLWNAVRFVLPHLEAAFGADGKRDDLGYDDLHLADRWILSRLDETIKTVTESLEPRGADGSSGLRFSEAAQALYRFTWDDFCSSYLEIRKKVITAEAATLSPEGLAAKRQAVSVFATVIEKLITILHPFMPFITEEIRQALGQKELLITSQWPAADICKRLGIESSSEHDLEVMTKLLRIVDAMRSIRGDYSLPPSHALDARISCDDEPWRKIVEAHKDIIASLERVGTVSVGVNTAKPAFSAAGLIPEGRLFIPLEGILDPAQEKVRLTKELGKAEGFTAAQEKKLSNESFVKSAPAEVVEGERSKLQSQRDKVEKLKAALADLG